jgi:hypothetical protein
MLRTHWELDRNTVATSWEQQKSNTPTLPQKKKNLGMLPHLTGCKKVLFAYVCSLPIFGLG